MIAPNRLFRNRVSKSDLEITARTFLEFLDLERIHSVLDLNSRFNYQYLLNPRIFDESADDSSDYIEIALSTSRGVKMQAISYVSPGVGSIIRGVMAIGSNNASFFVKSAARISDYIVLETDEFGNLLQLKSFDYLDFFGDFRSELRTLAR
jgi:hypothetical protein